MLTSLFRFFHTPKKKTLGCLLLITAFFITLHATDIWDSHSVLSMKGTDIEGQFYGWRDYGFSELKQGRIPFWNPYVYGGAPFLAGMQSALFYPPHFLYLMLPLSTAIDVLIVMHLIIGAIGFFFWARYRALPHGYAFLGGVTWSLCGVVYPHLLAGHLPNLIFLAWVPIWFHMLDKLLAQAVGRPITKEMIYGLLPTVLILAFTLALMILGGHPQYLYYLILGTGLYVSLHLFKGVRKNNIRISSAFLISFSSALLIGAAITAFQWIPMLFTLGETIRSNLGKDFSAMFSLPIENISTLILPHLFGDIQRIAYWGRCYLWEMCLYIGIMPFILFLIQFKYHWREHRPLLLLALIALLVALGKQTFLYDILYTILPGFSSFRGVSKIAYLAILAMLMLSLHSLQALTQAREKQRHAFLKGIRVPLYTLSALIALLGLFFFGNVSHSFLHTLIPIIMHSGESYFNLTQEQLPSFIQAAAHFMALKLFYAALLIAAVNWLLTSSNKILWKDRCLLLIAIGLLDIALFSRSFHATHEPVQMSPSFALMLEEMPQGARILNLQNPNYGTQVRYADVWGNDPFILRRYSEYMMASLSQPIEQASQYLPATGFKFHPMHAGIGLYGIATHQPEARWIAKSPYAPMPEAYLVQVIHIEKNMHSKFARMKTPGFDFTREAIIDEIPGGFFYKEVTPNPTEPKVEILDRTPGHYRLKLESANPALLVLGTNYSSGWQARGLPDSAQYHYTPIPANHTLLSIPINPGAHHITLDYIAPGWNLGLWISTLTLLLLLSAGLLFGWPKRLPWA